MESKTVQIGKSSIMRKLIAIVLLITLTMADFALVGVETVSYAVDALSTGTATNNKNVTFDVFFKDATGAEMQSKEEQISNSDIRLFGRVSVKNDGYFNGEVTLGESNFKLKSDVLSGSINKIEGNKVTLNQINSGETAEFELAVEPIKEDTIGSEFLNMLSDISLNGIYRNSEEKNISIDAIRQAQLILTSPYAENEGCEVTSQVITNKIYQMGNETKRIVQVLIQSGLKNNLYPVKEDNIEISVPEGTEKVEVHSRGTLVSNGQGEADFNESDWVYDEANKKINVSIKNEEQDGKIKWLKNGTDSLVVTYFMDATKDLENTAIFANNKISLFDLKGTLKETATTVKPEEEVDGVITAGVEVEENSMYKGKIYSGENREYKVKTNIFVNNSETEKTSSFDLNPSKYELNGEEIVANVQYLKTMLNKNNVLKILGDEGRLTLKLPDGSIIAQIMKNTEADEDGKVTVSYPEGVKEIIVETTGVKDEGTISMIHTKAIKDDGNSRDIKKAYTALKESVQDKIAEIQLKDTSNETKLSLNKNKLSTLIDNTGVEISAVLKTNSEENDLYTNPHLRIELPKQVEDAKINSANLLYDDELKIASTNVIEENGTKFIDVILEGLQTKHKAGTLEEGATVIINSDLVLNKKATNSDEALKMECLNENTESVINTEKPLKVVSPRGMITLNSIEDYGMTILGEEETKTAKLQLGAEEKQSQVKIEVINNNDETIKDVKILGNFPTKNETNTINTSVSAIELAETEGTVYYTENKDATDDINNSANGWTTNLNNNSAVKKFLIKVDNMAQSQGILASYQLHIPSGLQYNEQAYEGYKVTYSNENTENEVTATVLGLATGKGPELKTNIKATVGNTELTNGAEVAQGEVIRYEIGVENTGSEDATNVNVFGMVPEGTVYVEPKENFIYESGYYGEVADKDVAQFTVENIPAGKTVSKAYEVKVTKNATIDSEIANKSIVKYGEATAESDTIKNKVVDGNVSVMVKRATDLESRPYSGANLDYFVVIENISDSNLNNIKVNLNLPEELEPVSAFINEGVEEIINGEMTRVNKETLVEDFNKIKIDNLNAGETKSVLVNVDIKALKNESVKDVDISATVQYNNSKTARSNKYIETLEDAKLDISLTTNNEGGYLKSNDIVEYTIKIKNTSNIDSDVVDITDAIPEQLTIKSVTVNGEDEELLPYNTVTIARSISANEEIEAKISAVVNYSATRKEPEVISNYATLDQYGETVAKTQEVTHIIQVENKNNSGTNSGTNPNSGSNGGQNSGSNDSQTQNNRIISGTAWFDENQDGQRESNEKLLSGITVRLIDVDGNTIKEAKTNDKGLYVLDNVESGEYLVVFEYDTSAYITTAYHKEGVSANRNSDATTKEITIDGQTKTYGITDTVKVEENSIYGIDLGLIKATKFDLELNKYISKIIVQTGKDTKTYEYDKTTLAKAEISAKQVQGANVIIEYEIEVKNTGEAAGYVKKVADYIPAELKFSSELNNDWYQSGGYIYNNSLANTKLEAGETKTLTLTLTKAMSEENTGLINNKAEIAEGYNENGLQDIDSTSGNKVQKEDDMGSADVILGIKTGAMVTYVTLTISIIMLIGVCAYFVNKRINKNTDIEVNL